MCVYAVHYAAGVAFAWLPISQQVFSKGMEVSECGHRVRECVQLGVALVDEQPTLPHALQVAHKLFFEQAPVDRLLARRGSNQRRWNWQPTESDSLAQGRTRTPDTRPRCDVANIRLERERKARDLVLVTPKEWNSDCPCRKVH